jgi:signal transduction histidine kinase
MTSNRFGGRRPAAFTAAALRRALLLPLALSTMTGALVLGLAEHVREAMNGETQDEREMHAVDSIYRRLSEEETTLHHPVSVASEDKSMSELPVDLNTLDRAAQRHAKIAQRAVALSGLVREWMRERALIRGLPAAQAAAEHEEKALDNLRAQLDSLTADLLTEESADQAIVRRRFAEMLALVAVLSVVLGVVVAGYVRRDLVIVSKAFSERLDAEQEISRIKDDFVATLSHELKTPINAILGWTTLLRRRSDDAVTVRRALDRIERNARKQAKLVDDIVDMSCIVTGKLSMCWQSLELQPVVDSAVAEVRATAEMKKVRTDFSVDADAGPLWGDAQRVHQILVNLIDNAVKFAPAGGHVVVRARRAGDAVELRVSDNGHGIPNDFVPHAFGAFRQGESSASRAYGGLGLGLAIVRRLVDLHGGTVRVESPGEVGGATFVVTLLSSPRITA